MKNLSYLVLIGMLFAACEELDPREPGLLVPRTADQDASVPSIYVNGTVLHAETFGNPADPMLVVLHGGPGADYRYLLNCRAFANEGFFVVFYDQRGSGLSRREDKSVFSTRIMLDDLAGVIAHFRSAADQKVILLGQSWGAMLATAYINENPTAVTGAILGEPGGLVWADVKAYMKRLHSRSITSEGLNDAAYLDQFITGSPSDHELLDYKFGLSFAAASTADNPSGETETPVFWRLGAVVNQALMELGESQPLDFTTNLSAYTTKVLFVYSQRNQAYGPEYAQHVSSAYPSVQLERIDDVGHNLMTTASGWNNFFPIALTYLNELK